MLSITGIEVYAHHGVLPHEREFGQPFVLDVSLGLDTRLASETDDLRHTADYGSLVSRLVARVANDPVDLIETVADRAARECLLVDQVQWVQVSIHKPKAPITAKFDDVVLTIRRWKEGTAATAVGTTSKTIGEGHND